MTSKHFPLEVDKQRRLLRLDASVTAAFHFPHLQPSREFAHE
jgi:hypothetical protein